MQSRLAGAVPVSVARVVNAGHMKQTPLTGGESVFCINEAQLERAKSLAHVDSPEGDRVREAIRQLETEYTRNERAAIAFVLIDQLLKNNDDPSGRAI